MQGEKILICWGNALINWKNINSQFNWRSSTLGKFKGHRNGWFYSQQRPLTWVGAEEKSRPVSTIHVFVIARLISMKFQRDWWGEMTGASHNPYQTKAHKLPSDIQTSLSTRQSHWNSSMRSSRRQRWVRAASFLDSCKRLDSLSPPTFPGPCLPLPIPYSLSLLVPTRLTTPHVEFKAPFSTTQPNLWLQPVASWQLRPLIRSVSMLRSCVHSTAIYLELQPQQSD